MYKIAILVTQLGETQKALTDSFKARLNDYPNSKECEVKVIEVRSAAPSLIERTVRTVIGDEYDLIVPIGVRCTLASQKETAQRRYPIPVLFTGLCHPDGNGITQNKQKNILM